MATSSGAGKFMISLLFPLGLRSSGLSLWRMMRTVRPASQAQSVNAYVTLYPIPRILSTRYQSSVIVRQETFISYHTSANCELELLSKLWIVP